VGASSGKGKVMEVYLDNSATTACSPAAVEKMGEILTENYGNPSSLHEKGRLAENVIKESRSIIAKSLRCKEKEILFTSGGSEGDNLAIFGAVRAKARDGKHIITTSVEHPAAYEPVRRLEEEGYEVTYLPVGSDGRIRLSDLEEALREDTILVSIMYVNNEMGAIEPIEEAAKLTHEKAPKALFFTDAIQAYGKLPIYPGKIGVDLMSVSGHKLHGPKGSGFLYIREGVRILPEIYGGGQEGGLRSGTENVPAIGGLGVAVSELIARQKESLEKYQDLRAFFKQRISEIENVHLNEAGTEGDAQAPYIISFCAPGVRSEVLLHALEDRGIYVSAGSACSSHKPAPSRTLTAMGLTPAEIESTVRISMSYHTTEEELSYLADALSELLPMLRKYQRA